MTNREIEPQHRDEPSEVPAAPVTDLLELNGEQITIVPNGTIISLEGGNVTIDDMTTLHAKAGTVMTRAMYERIKARMGG